MKKILELCRKLKALADKGIDGEKDTAIQMLNKLMKKHSITMDMISLDEIKEHTFLVEVSKYRMWRQVVSNVLGRGASVFYNKYDKGKKKKHFVKCTPFEAIEIEAKFAFFIGIYEKEEVFYEAFIQKNHLFVKCSDDEEMQDKK